MLSFNNHLGALQFYQRSMYLIGVTLNASVFRIHKMVEILVLTAVIAKQGILFS